MITRRNFLATSLATAAPFALRAAPGTAPLLIGQIGTAHAHAGGKMTAMRSLPDVWKVAGLVVPEPEDPDAAARSQIYEGLDIMSEDELLSQADLRAVAVETRIEDSCATAERCIAAGKHVHLDKPGAISHEDFRRMRRAAEKDGLTVQMGYMLRYNPAFALLFQAVEEGWLGEITEIDAAMGKLADPGTRQAIGALEGGGMFELACHIIDAALTVLGRPTSVSAYSTPVGDDGVRDNQMAVLEYPHATAVIRCNHMDPFGGPRRRFNVTGTDGTFEILPLESGRVNLSLTEARGGYAKGKQSFQLKAEGGRYDEEFADLARVVRGEKELAWSATHDIDVHETVLRAAGIWERA